MAGTVTVEETAPLTGLARHTQPSNNYRDWLLLHTPLRRIKWSWTCTAGGAADQVTTYDYAGIVAAVTTDPGAGPPTDDYDIVINDEDGFDVLGGQGADRDTANTETVKDNAAFRYFGPGVLNLVVSAAGNATSGIVYLWVRNMGS